MNRQCIKLGFIIILTLISCTDEKSFNSPYDTNTDPFSWAPQNLSITQEDYVRIKLSWIQENTNIDGFKIHRRKESEDWSIPIATINKYSTEWFDTGFIADPDILYEYKIYAYAGSNQSTDITGTIRPEAIPNTFKDERDDKFYRYVEIGSQIWMAENLNYYTSTGSWYPNDSEDNSDDFGCLYDLKTAKISCPQGWHLPTDEEWKTLERTLGMDESEIDIIGERESGKVGEKLQKQHPFLDVEPSGFDAQFAGMRRSDGSYEYVGFWSVYWTRDAYLRQIIWLNSWVYRGEATYSDYGFCVRCIKD